jgi:hypothetical protein
MEFMEFIVPDSFSDIFQQHQHMWQTTWWILFIQTQLQYLWDNTPTSEILYNDCMIDWLKNLDEKESLPKIRTI